MVDRIRQWRTLLYVSLIYAGFGIVLGFVIGLAGTIVGSIFFTFENKLTLIVVWFFLTFFSGLFGLVIGIYIENTAYRKSKKVLTFLGNKQVEITADIMRSPNGTRQLRMTSIDAPEHYHLELLDPESLFVLESNICGKIKALPVKEGRKRWAAIVTISVTDLTVFHFLGLPPELTNNSDSRTLLPIPQILIIEQIDTDVFLFRLTKMGDYAGDTWHQSVEEAKKQAEFEYNVSVDDWQKIPSDVKDVELYLRNRR